MDRIELLEGRLREIVGAMIERDGVDASGAQEYYAGKLRENRLLVTDYDRLIPQHVAADRPDQVHYAGSGLGFMAFVLALSGIPAHCYENDGSRFRGFLHIIGELAKDFPAFPSLVTGSESTFPPEAITLRPGRNLLLFGNFGADTSNQSRDSIIDSFNQFDSVILSERLFCGVHNTEAQREELSTLILSKYKSERTPLDYLFVKYSR